MLMEEHYSNCQSFSIDAVTIQPSTDPNDFLHNRITVRTDELLATVHNIGIQPFTYRVDLIITAPNPPFPHFLPWRWDEKMELLKAISLLKKVDQGPWLRFTIHKPALDPFLGEGEESQVYFVFSKIEDDEGEEEGFRQVLLFLGCRDRIVRRMDEAGLNAGYLDAWVQSGNWTGSAGYGTEMNLNNGNFQTS